MCALRWFRILLFLRGAAQLYPHLAPSPASKTELVSQKIRTTLMEGCAGCRSNHRLIGSFSCWCFSSSFQWSWCLMLSKRSKNVTRSLDWNQLYKFWSSAGLRPRNTGGLTESLQSSPGLRIAASTWVCLLFSNKYFPIYFIFKTTKDKAYSAVKMNLYLDSLDISFFSLK